MPVEKLAQPPLHTPPQCAILQEYKTGALMSRATALRTIQRLREQLNARDWTADELRLYAQAAGALR